MKSILISIRPEWLCKILNGEKTIEIRKSAPNCELPITVYIYCTKGDRYLMDRRVVSNGEYEAMTLSDMRDPNQTANITPESECVLNGKIVARFTLKSVGKIKNHFGYYDMGEWTESHILEKSCLSYDELDDYLQTHVCGYGWHISDLVIFDHPSPVGQRPPQSWRYLEEPPLC